MDKLSKQQRHNNMAAIRSKDTKPEMILCGAKRQSRAVRRGLWKRRFRYRLNHKRLPGSSGKGGSVPFDGGGHADANGGGR